MNLTEFQRQRKRNGFSRSNDEGEKEESVACLECNGIIANTTSVTCSQCASSFHADFNVCYSEGS